MSHYNNHHSYRIPQVPNVPEMNIPIIFQENNGYTFFPQPSQLPHTNNSKYNDKVFGNQPVFGNKRPEHIGLSK